MAVQPAAVAKQLLPKTLGPSNVNVAAHVQHVPHMVSNAPSMSHSMQLIFLFSLVISNLLSSLKLYSAAENDILQ